MTLQKNNEFDLPASCLKGNRKQEGQEGGGGCLSPPSLRPIHLPVRKVQEGRRKQEGQSILMWRARMLDRQAEQTGKAGKREWRDGEGRDFRAWWDYMRRVIRVARESKDAKDAGGST